MADREPPGRVRLDRWLWAARFFKTRAQAKAAIEGGKVQMAPSAPGAAATVTSPGASGLQKPKVSKEVAVGDRLEIRRGASPEVVEITGLSDKRGSATVAAELYQETPESIEARETERAQRRMERAGLRVPRKRPSKRDRRELAKLKQGDHETDSS